MGSGDRGCHALLHAEKHWHGMYLLVLHLMHFLFSTYCEHLTYGHRMRWFPSPHSLVNELEPSHAMQWSDYISLWCRPMMTEFTWEPSVVPCLWFLSQSALQKWANYLPKKTGFFWHFLLEYLCNLINHERFPVIPINELSVKYWLETTDMWFAGSVVFLFCFKRRVMHPNGMEHQLHG